MARAPLSSPLWALLVASVVAVSYPARAQDSDGRSDQGAVPSGISGAVIKPPEPAPEAKKAVIVLPKLVHFENAPYPPEAEKAGIQAQVMLKLSIDVEGNVSKAEVMEPAGSGFDEAASAAALKFKFEPATRDGKPVAVVIPFRYSFTLTPKDNAPSPPAPTTGNLSGVVRIAGTDVPLVGARVVVTLLSGETHELVTDASGKWQLEALPAGHYKVHVEAAGFVAVEQAEDVAVGEATEATYRLAAQSQGLEFTVQGERPPREVTRRTIERREIERIPGTSGDALRSLQNLPGVARPPGLAGLLIVRGSAPMETNTFIDGSLVPIIYHFGGLSSVVPTEMLDKIDFYPGNFSARYGRVSGGIIDVGLKSPDTHCYADYGKASDKTGCFHGMAQVDLIDGRLMFQGPLPAKDWSFAVAGRRSWVDVWLKPVLESAGTSVTAAPVYYDYQAIVEHKTHDSRFSLRFFGSDDTFKIIITDPAAEEPAFGGTLSFGTSFYRAQALYETDLTSKVSSNSMLSFGKDSVGFALGTFLFNLDTMPLYARHEFGVKVAPGIKLDAGLDFLVAPYEVTARFPPPPRPGEPDPGPFVSRPPQETHQKSTVFRPAWYVEGELQPSDRWRVIPGVRLDYARDSNHADFAPRIVTRYDVVKGSADPEHPSLRTTLKGGAGYFYQPPQFQETDPVFGTPGLRSQRTMHYSVGVEQELTRHVDLSVEGFYKDITDAVSRAPNASGNYTYNNQGTGSVIGLETLLKYKPDARFFGWIAYTLSRSVRRDGPGQPEYLTQYDQTHNLIILGSYRLGRGWEFGARFRLVSGPLDTPLVQPPSLPALYVADAGAYAPLQGRPFSERLPLFHQLDLRIDKRWQFRTWRFSSYLDVQNVYNNAAVEGTTYNYNFSKQSYQTGIPIIPSIGVRGEF
ncbi:MAG TPA: TonB-dependent receptor [Polyangiaceae bacterium]